MSLVFIGTSLNLAAQVTEWSFISGLTHCRFNHKPKMMLSITGQPSDQRNKLDISAGTQSIF